MMAPWGGMHGAVHTASKLAHGRAAHAPELQDVDPLAPRPLLDADANTVVMSWENVTHLPAVALP
jgi:hypothetical protein